MRDKQTTENQSPGKRSPWPKAIFLFFAVIFALNGVYVYLAVNSHHGAIEDQTYERGVDYQQTIDALERAANSGWQYNLEIGPVTDLGKRAVRLSLSDDDKQPLESAAVMFSAKHPASKHSDLSAPLEQTTASTYQTELAMPRPGLWLIEVNVDYQGQLYLWRSREVL